MRRALLAVLVFLLALLVVMLLRRHGPIDHRSPSPATPDLGAGAVPRARAAPPLRLPSARAVELRHHLDRLAAFALDRFHVPRDTEGVAKFPGADCG